MERTVQDIDHEQVKQLLYDDGVISNWAYYIEQEPSAITGSPYQYWYLYKNQNKEGEHIIVSAVEEQGTEDLTGEGPMLIGHYADFEVSGRFHRMVTYEDLVPKIHAILDILEAEAKLDS